MEKNSSQGTGLIDAYVDLIAHREKWVEKGDEMAQELLDITLNDPVIRGMLTSLINVGIGSMGITTAPGNFLGVWGALEGAEWLEPSEDFERHAVVEERALSRKQVWGMQSYSEGLRALENSSTSS